MAAYIGKGSGGSTYEINSDKGKNFVSNATAGTTMQGGDGSTWTKNADGSTTIIKGGQTWTVGGATPSSPSSGGGSTKRGSSSGGSSGSASANVNASVNKNAYTGTSPGGGSYTIGSEIGIDFIENKPIGSTMQGGDGSTWVKNADGSVTIVQNGTVYTVGGGGIVPAVPEYEEVTMPEADEGLSDAIREQQAAALEAELAALKTAYDKSMTGYQSAREQIPDVYDAARNRAASNSARARREFVEHAQAHGLNSGVTGQEELARSSSLMSTLAGIDREEAAKLADIARDEANLTAQYENAIAQATATGNAALASALYSELLRVQEQQREDAQLAAKYGDTTLLDTLLGINGGTGGSTPTTQQSITQNDTQFVPTVVPGTGYDNGSLTNEQVKQLQAHFGLDEDGYWGPNSQSTTGMSANDAWRVYQSEVAQGSVTIGNKGKLDYDPDEGVFVWNGKRYSDIYAFLADMERAGLTVADELSLAGKFKLYGFDVSFD